MPVVTRARTGWVEGTGVAAREKLRTPAATTATPITIRPPPQVHRMRAASASMSGKGRTRSRASPNTRHARYKNGGRVQPPATAVSRRCHDSYLLLGLATRWVERQTAHHYDNI